MAKAASPIRLQQELMQSASIEGELFNRSATEQVEYWAGIGRRLSNVIESDTLLSITAGLATLHVQPLDTKPIEPDQVFNRLQSQRGSGELSAMVKNGRPRYQASVQYPGLLERIDEHGELVAGHFQDGVFMPEPKAK